jgi:hypothetical protein
MQVLANWRAQEGADEVGWTGGGCDRVGAVKLRVVDSRGLAAHAAVGEVTNRTIRTRLYAVATR